jgi:hypothetical protein
VAEVIGLSHSQDQTLASALISAERLYSFTAAMASAAPNYVLTSTTSVGTFSSALVFIEALVYPTNTVYSRSNFPIAVIPNQSSQYFWLQANPTSNYAPTTTTISSTASTITLQCTNASMATNKFEMSGIIAILS